MKLIFTLIISGVFSIMLNLHTSNADVRKAAVSGQFYPDNPEKLRLTIKTFLENAYKPLISDDEIEPVAIIAPHAGYVYSGQIAADAFAQVIGKDFETVIIIAPNHTTAPFNGISVYSHGAFETPLGKIAIDEEFAGKLMASDHRFVFKADSHINEHAVEVQVPFVQVLFPSARIVPVVVGSPDPGLCKAFGKAIFEASSGKKTLTVISSDLSHYPPYSDARKIDLQTLDAILTMNTENFLNSIARSESKHIRGLGTCACGEGPILAAFELASLSGCKAHLVSYANSGDTFIGDQNRVVGYGAVLFAKSLKDIWIKPLVAGPPDNDVATELSETDQSLLLNLARTTISDTLTVGAMPLARGFSNAAYRRQGAFVTLKKHGELRGCIGHMAENLPLVQVVGKMAMAAAFRDPRFRPVRHEELKDIEIEISVLTPFKKVSGYDDIVVGRDGVLLQKQGASAVFLPQVAPEQGWDRDEMLSHLCMKAGLDADCWKQKAEFMTFQAKIFSEK